MLKPGSLGAAASRAPASQPQLGCLRGLPLAFLTDCAFATSRLAEGTLAAARAGPLGGAELLGTGHSGRKAGPRLAVQLPRRALERLCPPARCFQPAGVPLPVALGLGTAQH